MDGRADIRTGRAALAAACLLLLGACATRPALETDESTPPPSEVISTPCVSAAEDEVPVLDRGARALHETLCDASLWLDGLLGGTPDVEAARSANGRLEVANFYSHLDGNETKLRLRAEIELASTERRFGAFFGIEDDEEFVRDRDQSVDMSEQAFDVSQDRRWLAGLGYRIGRGKRLQAKFDIGVRGSTNPEWFARVRNTWLAVARPVHRLEFRLTPFWTDSDLFGATAGIDYSAAIGNSRVLRWSLVATRSDATVGADWRNSLIFYQNLKRHRGIASELYARGESGAPEPLYEYGVREILRLPLFRSRMFLELVMGYFWRREDPALDRQGASKAGIVLKWPFGQR